MFSFLLLYCNTVLQNLCMSFFTSILHVIQNQYEYSYRMRPLKRTCYTQKRELTSWCQFHQHFMSSLCAKILLPKNYKPKLLAHKSCAKNFGTKKLLVKYW